MRCALLKSRLFGVVFPALLLFAPLVNKAAHAQSGLQVTYGSNGIQTLSYNGVTLENTNLNASDAFHIWHMQATDLNGNVLTTGQYGWGENNNGRAWDASTHTFTYTFSWGKITTQFVQSGNDLNMIVNTTNNAGSGIIFDGATIYPMSLNFPVLPAGFTNNSDNQFSDNTSGPGVTVANFGSGQVTAVDPSATESLYTGFQPTGSGFAYTPIMSGTSPDALASYLPHNNRPVKPGATDSFTVSLRFTAAGTATSAIASDAYASWAATYPSILQWSDRRAIGTIYLASSPAGGDGNTNSPGGYPTNPRRWWNDPSVNITTAAGLQAFQTRMLAQAETNVTDVKNMNAQGTITWDIEGEQYPQTTSYVCSPDQIATVAPEMESVVNVPGSAYKGMKLDDAYFKIMTSAGIRVGVCVRPQQFKVNANKTASQQYLADSAVAQELINKMQYAYKRWGTTLFYVDSTVNVNGGTLAASIFKQAAEAMPQSLLIPEESTPLHYAYTAPFASFIDLGSLGTPASVHDYYPNAFSANLVNDVASATLTPAIPQLTEQVHTGDILMGHADYWQANDPVIQSIYAAAGTFVPSYGNPTPTPTPTPTPPPAPTPAPPPAPAPTPPAPTPTPAPSPTVPPGATPTAGVSTRLWIVSPATGTTEKGTITITGATTLTVDSSGTYLMVDGQEIGTQRVTGGPYLYLLDTKTLTNGPHTLQLWGHDIGNSTWVSMPIVISVEN